MSKHVMLDLETWGTDPYSVIIQIGVCQFDPHTDDQKAVILNSFEVAVDPISSQKAGLRIDAGTVAWWMDPSRDAPREEWFMTLKFELPLALDGFDQWLDHICTDPTTKAIDSEHKDVVMWGNGSDFDNVLLASAYKAAQRDVPWKFYNNRCFRTLKNLAPQVTRPRALKAHTALADAMDQAHWANKIIRELSIKI